MPHPPVADLFALDSAEVRAHVAACELCRSLVALDAPASATEAGDDQYGELSPITGGGMSETGQARDRRLGRSVVIKRPLDHPDPAIAAMLRARFEREARLTARLEHPAIVPVYESGRWRDGAPYYAMRLVRGHPLADELARPLAARLALIPRLIAVADALAYAHAHGVVHRDVKPHNIMLGPFGETILIDWGLAHDPVDPAPSEASTAIGGTLTELGVGTPAYMAPEQAAGAPADPRMDVYALGMTLRELLGEVAPLAAIAERATRRDPAERFASARDVADELRAFLDGRLIASHRYNAREVLALWVKKHRAAVAVGGAAALALTALAVFSARRVIAERDHSELARMRAEGLTASALAANPTRRTEALALAVAAARADDAPPEAIQGLVDALAAGPGATVLAGVGMDQGALSPDGTRLATSMLDGTLRIYAVPSGAQVATFPTAVAHAAWIAFAPDGQHVVLCGHDAVAEIFAVAGGSVRVPLDRESSGCAFADARTAVVTDGELRAWGVDGAPLGHADLGAAPSTVEAGDGAIYAGALGGGVWRWRVGQAAERLGAHAGDVTILARDGDGVLSGGRDGAVRRWPGGALIFDAHAPIVDVALSSAGTLVVSRLTQTTTHIVAPDGTIRWEIDGYGRGIRDNVLTGPDHPIVRDALTGKSALVVDSQALAYAPMPYGEQVMITARGERWWVDLGLVPIGPTAEVTGLAVDGDALIASSLDGTLRRWSLAHLGAGPTTTRLGSAVISLAAPDVARLADGTVWVRGARVAGDVVAVAPDGTVFVGGIAGGSWGTHRISGEVTAARFVGDRLYLGGPGGLVRALDTRTGNELARRSGGAAPIVRLDGELRAATADGPTLELDRALAVVATRDGTLIGDAIVPPEAQITAALGELRGDQLGAIRAEAFAIHANLGAVTALVALPGDRFAAGYASGAVRIYPRTRAAAISLACEHLARTSSPCR